MRIRTAWNVGVGVGLGLALVAVPGAGAAQEGGYLDHRAFSRELRSVVDGSSAARLETLATSPGGREVWLVTLGAPGEVPLDERPALLVVGTLEGDHVLGSHLALEAVRRLAEAAGADDEAGRLLRETTVYVVPRANPDGAEAMFGTLRHDRRRNARPYDDDNDGRTDEDGPDDLNGDGLVTLMRVPDAEGAFMVHPDDPRLMKRADAARGERGTHTLYVEGRDDDGDGFYNEDGPGGVDLNRNFQHVYPYWEADAGPHMVSEPESRALIDFVVAHDNIGAVLTFGHSDNLVTPPDSRGQLAGPRLSDLESFAAEALEGIYEIGVYSVTPDNLQGALELRGAQPGRDNDPDSGRRPSETVHADDLAWYRAVSERYRDVTGIEEVGFNRAAEGAFFQYGYFQYGVPSFSTQGWASPSLPDGTEAADDTFDARMLAARPDGFVDWVPVDHPQLGQVEVGGFRPHVLTNPPPSELADLGSRHADFVVALAGMLPRVRIAETEVTAHGGGVFTVEAVVENTGFFPTTTRHGVVSRSIAPTLVRIGVEPEAIVTGDPKTAEATRLEGSGRRERFTWVIRGREGASVEIVARSEKGGSDRATVTLR